MKRGDEGRVLCMLATFKVVGNYVSNEGMVFCVLATIKVVEQRHMGQLMGLNYLTWVILI